MKRLTLVIAICLAFGEGSIFSAAAQQQPVFIDPASPATTAPNTYPTSLAASGGGATWLSGCIPLVGRAISVGTTSSQAGTISIQRYADAACTLAVSTAISSTLVGAVANGVSVNDGLPANYFQISIVNTSGVSATVASTFILQRGF